jgi:uncharacterized protein YkwD
MRKPLVVVCGVTAAALIAGGIAATTAGADERPGVPGIPGLDLSGLPQWGGSDDDSEPGPAVTFPDLGGGDDDQADDQDDQDAGAADQDQAATPHRGGGQAAAQERPAQDQQARDQTAKQQPAAARPQVARPQVQAQPQAQGGVMAAAQRKVSPAMVSTSPQAPVQQQVLALVNQNRRSGGCGGLSLDRRLIVAADGHASDMARRGYFAHESPAGEGSSDRMSEAGYRWSRYGENIARGQDSVYEVVNGWMHSPEHRENIMDCKLDQMGIGLAFAPDRTPYWVQDFGTPQG